MGLFSANASEPPFPDEGMFCKNMLPETSPLTTNANGEGGGGAGIGGGFAAACSAPGEGRPAGDAAVSSSESSAPVWTALLGPVAWPSSSPSSSSSCAKLGALKLRAAKAATKHDLTRRLCLNMRARVSMKRTFLHGVRGTAWRCRRRGRRVPHTTCDYRRADGDAPAARRRPVSVFSRL